MHGQIVSTLPAKFAYDYSMSSTIAVYFANTDVLLNKINSPLSLAPYIDIAHELQGLGGKVVFCAGADAYAGHGWFEHTWGFSDQFEVKENGPAQAEVILARTLFPHPADITVVNTPELYKVLHDKFLAQRMFEQYHARTVKVDNDSQLAAALQTIPGELKVVKPVEGSHSDGVVIGTESELLAQTYKYPLLVEEWLDSSRGIDGITPGEHDLRIVMIENRPSLVLVRIPAKSEHRAGLEVGASMLWPSLGDIPASVIHMVQNIDTELQFYPGRVYSVDTAMTIDGPRVIELNVYPALFESNLHPHVRAHNRRLALHLMGLAKSPASS